MKNCETWFPIPRCVLWHDGAGHRCDLYQRSGDRSEDPAPLLDRRHGRKGQDEGGAAQPLPTAAQHARAGFRCGLAVDVTEGLELPEFNLTDVHTTTCDAYYVTGDLS